MTSDIQLGIVLAIVAAAAAYLGVALWRFVTNRGSGGCGGGCHGCGAKESPPQALVTLEERLP